MWFIILVIFNINVKKTSLRKVYSIATFYHDNAQTLPLCPLDQNNILLNQFYRLPIFSNNKNYSAELVNKSNLTVVIKAVVKKSDKVTQSFGLAPKGGTTVSVSKDETVFLKMKMGRK